MNLAPETFQTSSTDRLSSGAASETLLAEYAETLRGKATGTTDAYLRVLRQLLAWLAERPGGDPFDPRQLTRTAIEVYLAELGVVGYSISHRARVKAVVSGFARWLIEDKALLRRNPARGVAIPAQPVLAPRQLSPDQRYVLRSLVEREGSARGAALFALGYWVGCRVSDAAWLRLEHAHVGLKVGWLHVGYKGGKSRDLDLVNEARRPFFHYLEQGGRDPESPFVFTSQRSDRFTEAGVHYWFRTLKERATRSEWELVADITYHDLRHDFAHRARAAGWSLEEVAYYLGHVTRHGFPAIQTTARYTQVGREAVRAKLRHLTG
jgi:site-specific recombinase XerD